MAALADNVGLLFRIKADSSQATKEMNQLSAKFLGLGDDAVKGFAGISAAALPVAAAIAAVTSAAAIAGAALVKLAFDASEYGSTIFDAQEKTGLAAATLSTLRVAADASGSSFEGVSASVSKFAVLVGQANQGNEKAIATLDAYGIKSRDLNGALNEAIAVIGREKDVTIQAAAAKELFKDRSGALIPVIKQLGGDLQKATEDAKRLGLTLSEDDVKAADDLGDAFGVLSAQIKAGAARFALQYAPQITDAIKNIGKFVADNKDAWAEWGRGVYNAVTGAVAVLNGLGTAANNILAGITLGLSNQVGAWNIWAGAARVAIGIVSGGLSEVLLMIEKIGNWINSNQPGSVGGALNDSISAGLGGSFNPGSGGGGRGGGGRRAGGGAAKAIEDPDRKAIQELQAANGRALAAYKALLDAQSSELKQSLNQRQIDEVRYAKAIEELQLKALLFEQNLNDKLLKDERLNNAEQTDAKNKQIILIRQIAKARIDIGNAVYEAIKKQTDKEVADFEAAEEKKRKAEEFRLQKKHEFKMEIKRKLQEERDSSGFGAGFEGGLGESSIMSNVTDPLTGVTASVANATNAFKVLGEIGGQAVNAIAAGIGNMVQQWVLYGSAGPNAMKKMLASVLAGVAAQAAVLAIMELAYGIAALTPWGFAIYGSPVAHFKAAALFGSVAVGTALGGRAIAGDSFSQSTAGGGSGGSGGGDGAGQPEKLNFTERFNGFQQGLQDQMARVMQRTNEVLGGVTDAVDTFNSKFGITTPGAVVMAGAGDAGEAIFGAVTGHLDSDLRASSNFIRSQGKME